VPEFTDDDVNACFSEIPPAMSIRISVPAITPKMKDLGWKRLMDGM
jgi:hypothetical protein